MKVINTQTLEIKSLTALRAEFSKTSFPAKPTDAQLSDFGYAVLHVDAEPSLPVHQSATKNPPQIVNGEWRVTWAVSDRPIEDVRAVRLEDLAAKRYEVETGGVTVGGVTVDTDRESQTKLIAARIAAKEDTGYTVPWKTPNGFVSLDAAAIIAIADAVRAHVQACYDNEATHAAAVETLTTAAEVAAYDISTGWPEV